MASRKAIAGALALLAEARPREITPHTVQVYAMALEDVDDDALGRATARALRELKFFPAPAELRDFAGANRAPAIDVEPVLAAIAAMGSYLPTSGTTYPRVEAVRQRLGDGVAEAYSLAGGARVFSGNEVTRDIARREFSEALRDIVRERGEAAALAPVAQVPALPAPSGPIIFGARPAVSGPVSIGKLLTRGES